jgi:hypothetical protein
MSYYSLNCTKCPQDECKICQNKETCLECIDGYFLPQETNSVNWTQFKSDAQCMKCDENCKTCFQNSRMCTSCNGNYTLSLENSCEGEYQLVFTLTFDMRY